ncbi:hypothetical protein C5C29_12510 [Rathayibacter sp. AY1H2]|nr:hypothetical protein C5C29_12510 [Rathayibacter sp. AY1H2]
MQTAPGTFDTRKGAQGYLATVQADQQRGTWRDPKTTADSFVSYARAYISAGAARGLAPRTVDGYETSLRLHLADFHPIPVDRITAVMVREWHARKAKTTGSTALRNAYILLHAVLAQAVDDEVVVKNPARVKDAGTASAPERPYLSLQDYKRIHDALVPDLQPVVALIFGASLRLGEAAALLRADLDAAAGTVTISKQESRGDLSAPTKTQTSRSIHVLNPVLDELRAYLASRPSMVPTDPLFTRSDGRRTSRGMIDYEWRRARAAVGLKQFHLHDLRHASLTLASETGATLREVQARGGHKTPRAALIYMHASEERNKLVAEAASVAFASVINDIDTSSQIVRSQTPL